MSLCRNHNIDDSRGGRLLSRIDAHCESERPFSLGPGTCIPTPLPSLRPSTAVSAAHTRRRPVHSLRLGLADLISLAGDEFNGLKVCVFRRVHTNAAPDTILRFLPFFRAPDFPFRALFASLSAATVDFLPLGRRRRPAERGMPIKYKTTMRQIACHQQ